MNCCDIYDGNKPLFLLSSIPWTSRQAIACSATGISPAVFGIVPMPRIPPVRALAALLLVTRDCPDFPAFRIVGMRCRRSSRAGSCGHQPRCGQKDDEGRF